MLFSPHGLRCLRRGIPFLGSGYAIKKRGRSLSLLPFVALKQPRGQRGIRTRAIRPSIQAIDRPNPRIRMMPAGEVGDGTTGIGGGGVVGVGVTVGVLVGVGVGVGVGVAVGVNVGVGVGVFVGVGVGVGVLVGVGVGVLVGVGVGVLVGVGVGGCRSIAPDCDPLVWSPLSQTKSATHPPTQLPPTQSAVVSQLPGVPPKQVPAVPVQSVAVLVQALPSLLPA
jgi:hypothetical protein